ncbi:bacillithiol system redox-active protein YtxJ [Bacillus xiapuensis]|uniref:bacillithiol system redox-active protein YtxJ n=1 Tax=Bacillus xiapuensis TaxID=2014075 RepID=UPI000C23B33C|nr:bacillithiol system redox-active protein YtxJ [Bacillus xiapuensis]
MEKIELIADFERLLEENDRFFLMKHSSTCPVSANAFHEVQSFLTEEKEKGYYLTVQDSRELSNYIADKFAVIHQSPQVFLIIDGQAAWNESHWKITKETLKRL